MVGNKAKLPKAIAGITLRAYERFWNEHPAQELGGCYWNRALLSRHQVGCLAFCCIKGIAQQLQQPVFLVDSEPRFLDLVV